MRVLLVVYDNGSYIHDFPLGIAYLAAVLRKEKFDVAIYHQDLRHDPDEELTAFLNQNRFDVVGVGVIGGYYQYRKLLSLSRAINQSNNRPFYLIGGHGPSPEPEFFLRKTGADVAVIGEGERTIIQLLQALGSCRSLKTVRGIAYREGDKVVINERQPLIEDIDQIPLPAYDLFPMEYYRLFRASHCTSTDFIARILSGRGCTFQCNFCYRMDKGFRPRSSAAIIDEIKMLQRKYGITYVGFVDELLMSSVERTEELCRAFLASGLKFRWGCNGRLNYAKPDLLKLMKQSGCVFINYGIEAMDDQILKNMNKALTTRQVVSGIEATLAAGLSPGFNIIFGNIGETRETLQKGVDFLLRYDDGVQMRTIRPVTPYPGSPLYDYAIQKGLLKDCEDFYEHKHLNSDLLAVNFTNLSDDEFHAALFDANKQLLENYFKKKCASYVAQARALYFNKDANFRGFRQT